MTERGLSSAAGVLFLPSFCGMRALFVLVVLAQLLAFLLTLWGARTSVGAWTDLSLVSLFVQWVALSSAAVFCALRPWLTRVPKRWSPAVAYLMLLTVTAATSAVAAWVMPASSLSGGPFGTGPVEFLTRNLVASALISAVVLRYFYVQHQWRRQIEAESEARLQALQARIRPHFLFNSMNTIASLTRTDPGIAEEVVEDLADLFRVSLTAERHNSTLAEELDLAKRYLRIEAQRLGPRIRVRWELDRLPDDAHLPPLTLQPLLENAVYHGVEPNPEGGEVLVQGGWHRDKIALLIRNSLPPGGGERHREGNRIALQNIEQRLSGFFQGEARLAVSLVDAAYQVRLLIPYRRDAE